MLILLIWPYFHLCAREKRGQDFLSFTFVSHLGYSNIFLPKMKEWT